MEDLMPFKSEKQRKFLWIHHPAIAQRWADEYGSKPKPSRTKTFATTVDEAKSGKKKEN